MKPLILLQTDSNLHAADELSLTIQAVLKVITFTIINDSRFIT